MDSLIISKEELVLLSNEAIQAENYKDAILHMNKVAKFKELLTKEEISLLQSAYHKEILEKTKTIQELKQELNQDEDESEQDENEMEKDQNISIQQMKQIEVEVLLLCDEFIDLLDLQLKKDYEIKETIDILVMKGEQYKTKSKITESAQDIQLGLECFQRAYDECNSQLPTNYAFILSISLNLANFYNDNCKNPQMARSIALKVQDHIQKQTSEKDQEQFTENLFWLKLLLYKLKKEEQ